MPLPELRFALRRLHCHRSAATAAVLTLALGIGAVTALFSVVRAVLLEPPPFRAPDELVGVTLTPRGRPDTRLEISWPDYGDWRAESRSFADLAAYQTALGRVVWEAGGDPVPVSGTMVSGSFFQLLGTLPALGRTLGPEDDRPGAELALVLSDGLWRRAFGARPDVLGRTVSPADVRARGSAAGAGGARGLRGPGLARESRGCRRGPPIRVASSPM
jgi:hypothetical protein